ncbi:MAG TPA: ABC transporter substrate-binding protein [Dehalococcoidales bacterium]|nr:ABC transporter substrate-binding protein [Dehalococcoidales bacterium]
MKNKRILKLVGNICMVAVLTLTLVLISGCTPAEGVYEIGISQYGDFPALNDACEGFQDALTAAVEAAGGNVTYDVQNAATDSNLAATIAQSFVTQGVDLICAIATPCAQAAALAVNETDIPVVFNSVTNPVAAGLVDSWDVPGGQVTGVSDLAPVEPQLELIEDILVANNITFGTLGVIYNPGEANSVYQVDVQLADAIASLALNITVEESPAYSTGEVLAAAEALVGLVDAIWIPTDNTVVTSIASVVTVCEDNDIPLFAADVNTVATGAVGAWGVDYYNVGYTSGEMAADILLNGANPATMAVQTLPAELLYVYPEEATRMGINITQSIIDIADVVVTD